MEHSFLEYFTLVFSIITLVIVFIGTDIGIPVEIVEGLPYLSLGFSIANIFCNRD